MLKNVISENRGKPFIDDIAVKPKAKSYFRDSNGRPEAVAPGIRRFVLEAIISLDKVLADIEQVGATISGEKNEFLKQLLKVVAYICGEKGRSPEEVKMKKIEDWPPGKNVTDVRAFIGLCVYYRIWIRDSSVIAEPLFRLMKKDQDFEWQEDQQEAMGALKKSLTEAPALKPIASAKKNSVVTRYISKCALYLPHISSFTSRRPAFNFPPCPPSNFTCHPIHNHISPLALSTPTRPHFPPFSLDN